VKLSGQELPGQLARQLASAYVVSGDEPLLVLEALEAIRARARQEGFEQRDLHVVERGFKWADLQGSAENLSLFAARRILELRLPSPRPGEAGARTIRVLAERPDPDRLLLIGTTKLDSAAARSAWIRSVESHGVVVQVWPIDRPNLTRWIRDRAARVKLELSAGAAELLADRVEGNLLAADQEIKKLALILGDRGVSEETVLEAVASSSRFDVFRLTDAVIAGDARRAMAVLRGLRAEGVEPVLISWALSRELCLLARLKASAARGENEEKALAQQGVWRRRQTAVTRAVRRFELDQLTALLARASEVDSVLKGIKKGRPWNELTGLVLASAVPGWPSATQISPEGP